MTAADVADSATYGEASGTIRTMAQAVIEGNSHFYVTLEGDDAIYDFVLPGAIKIVGYAVGDEVSFTYVENDPTCTVSEITSGKGKEESKDESGALEESVLEENVESVDSAASAQSSSTAEAVDDTGGSSSAASATF